MGWTNRLLKPSSTASFQAMSSSQQLEPPLYSCCQGEYPEYPVGHTGATSIQHLHQQPAMRECVFEKLVHRKN